MYPRKIDSVVRLISTARDVLKMIKERVGDGFCPKPNKKPGISITMM